jgi:hypothetical protein
LPAVVTYLQLNCVKEDLDERDSHTHGNTQLRRTDGSQRLPPSAPEIPAHPVARFATRPLARIRRRIVGLR